jgi:hypothetical protein
MVFEPLKHRMNDCTEQPSVAWVILSESVVRVTPPGDEHHLAGRRLQLAGLDVLTGNAELQLLGLAAVDG